MRLDGLLAQLGEIDGLHRLRFTTSHPRDMDAALIAAHGNNEKAHALFAFAGAIGLGQNFKKR